MRTDEMVVDVSQDWLLACDVQQRFMQSLGRAGGSLDYSARCRQLRALGGDCYDFTPLAEDRLAVVVGDASGKGLAAALMIGNVQSSLRAASLFTGKDLSALFKTVNHLSYTSSLEDHYATLFYGVFDEAARTLHYVNAGHNPPVVLRGDGSMEWLDSGGAPIGLLPDSNYDESLVQLEPGDLVIAYTDGVIEAMNPDGHEWGLQGLLDAASSNTQCAANAENLVQLLFSAMDNFSKGNQTDDATLAVVRIA